MANRMRRFAAAAISMLTLVSVSACGKEPSPSAAPQEGASTSASPETSAPIASALPPAGNTVFTDISAAAGIKIPSGPWPDGKYQTPEITAGGVAVFDYDGDGDR